MKKRFRFGNMSRFAAVVLVGLMFCPAVAQSAPGRAGSTGRRPVQVRPAPTKPVQPQQVRPAQPVQPQPGYQKVCPPGGHGYHGYRGYQTPVYPGPSVPLPAPGTYYVPNPYYNTGYYNNGYYNNGYYNNSYYNNGYYNGGGYYYNNGSPSTGFPPFQGY